MLFGSLTPPVLSVFVASLNITTHAGLTISSELPICSVEKQSAIDTDEANQHLYHGSMQDNIKCFPG